MAPRLLTISAAKVAPVLMFALLALASQPAHSVSEAPPRGTGNPFDQLKGDWTGSGVITPSKGGPTKVDCKATYSIAGSAVTQALLCTGEDYRFDAKTKFKYNKGKISGSWNETTYDASGNVSGSALGDLIHARISGDKFSGRMSIKVSDSDHTINIVQLDNKSGAYRLAASMSLHR
jgi:hypothetical protein